MARTRRGRPRRSIEKVREFGKLVECELKHGGTLKQALFAIHRSDPRWGGRRTMMRLWAAYQVDLTSQALPLVRPFFINRDLHASLAKYDWPTNLTN